MSSEFYYEDVLEARKEGWAAGFKAARSVIPTTEIPSTATDIVKAIREAEYRGYMKAVEDRPQGEWIKDNLGIVICSECKRPRRDNRVNHINFCNSCGAKMKGASE